MTDPRWQLIQTLFEEAARLEPGERDAMLADRCGQDATLRVEVESLLHHDDLGSEFLEPACEVDVDNSQPVATDDPLIGVEVGSCRLVRLLGSGGMGAVYEGRQADPDRAVAVKVLMGLAWSSETRSRFQFETRILALLDHPGIAKIFQAATITPEGTTRALPCFVMEYIAGATPLVEYVRREDLRGRDRLHLILNVCEAVQYAHGKGVIHRDLKPQNMLVDAEGRLKVIDFGVAKATESDLAVPTLRTDVGQLIGTLQYMSPEQCLAEPDKIDTRTDVYSLGVVLYELLCDRLPYSVRKTSIGEATRIVCEERPPTPLEVDRSLGKNLSAIVMMAIEKDPLKRYHSVAELDADIRRYLKGQPVTARPPSVSTRAAYWVARHPAIGTASICTGIALTVLALTMLWTTLYLRRPVRIVPAVDGAEARLYAAGGDLLKSWSADVPINDSIRLARFVEPSANAAERSLAVLAFADAGNASPFPHSLCVFDVDRSHEEPWWHRQIENDYAPVVQASSGPRTDFNVVAAVLGDVFGTVGGDTFDEIIAIHQHVASTRSAIRIYDLLGSVLFEVWIKTQVLGLYWMHEEQLLVLAGLNGNATWAERGQGPAIDPLVVFAIHLEEGLVSRDYLGESVSTVPGPAWYRCVLPAEVCGTLGMKLGCLTAPRNDASRTVRLSLHSTEPFAGVAASLDWVIDAEGKIVPGSTTWNDRYHRNLAVLPDPRDVGLGDLPAIED